MRRLFAVFFFPWFSIFLFCFAVSWYSLFYLSLDLLLAPVLKFWLLVKPLLLKTLPALLLWLWTHTGAKVLLWIGDLASLLVTMLGGWKAWSAKKIARQVVRFLLSLSARFVAVSVLMNLLFSHERKGIRLLPRLLVHRLKRTWFGRIVRFWKRRTERQKRLLLGVLLCIILIMAGQAMLGISVLLFDLAWELVLLLWRAMLHLWRFLGPILLRMVPTFIGNFVTHKLIPLVTEIVPIIRDDHRVIFMRLNIRRHLRMAKAWLYLRSRARRSVVRDRITPLVNKDIRATKKAVLSAAIKLRSSGSGKADDTV